MRKLNFLSKLCIAMLLLLVGSEAYSSRKISFQTKIIRPDGTNLEAGAVNFKFTLTDPSGTCVIYSEIFSSVDMSNSSGSLTLLLGNGARSYPSGGGLSWSAAFDNKTASYNCAPPSSATYTPVAGDARKLYVQFNDGSTAGSQMLPAMEVSAVPYAMYADSASSLDDHPVADFVLKGDVSTCGGGQVLTYNGSSFSCVTAGTNSGGASGYNFVNTTTNGATNITAQPNGTATSSGIAVYNSSSGANNSYGSIIAGASAVDIRSGVNGTGTQLPLTFTVGSSEAMRFDTSGNMGVGTNAPTSKLDVSGALTMRGMTAPSVSGAGQGRIYFDSVSNKFKVSENGGAYVDLLGAGSSGFVNGGNSFGANATLGTSDNYNLGFKTNNTTQMTIDNTGKVGIGTATPGSALDVKGTLRLSGSTSGYVGFAPAAAAGSTTYTLPAADGTASQVLTTNGSGVLSWSTPAGSITSVGGTAPISSSGGATPTISISQSNTTTDGYLSSTDWNTFNNKLGTATSFSGDVSGAYNSTSVDKIKGKTVSPAAYSAGQVLRYDGTNWVNTALGFSDLSGKPTTLAGYGITDAQSSTLASGKLLVGNGSNVATAVSMSGDATMDNAGAVTLATVPVSKGGTNVTSFTANKIVGTNGTGTALTSFSCALGEVITFDVSGAAICQSVAAASGAFVNGGNSYGANATLGTSDNFNLGFKTNNSTRMTIDNTGNVGVGITSPVNYVDIVQPDQVLNGGTLPYALKVVGGTNSGTYPAVGGGIYLQGGGGGATGGGITLKAGDGAGPVARGSGGTITLGGGDSTSGFGGDVTITSGAGSNGDHSGNVNITAATGLGGAGAINITGGSAGYGNANGGNVVLNGGVHNGTASDGNIILANTRGFVGIGTISPGSALDVKGTLRLSGSTSGYVGFAPAAAAGSTTYTLPAADGTASQVLTTNGSGVLSWSTPAGSITSVGGTAPISSSGGATPTISIAQSNTTTDGYLSSTDWNTFNNKLGTGTSFSGDVSGAYNSTSVDKIKGKTVSPAAYSAGQVLRYDGTNWVNTALGFSDLSGKPTTLAGYGITDAQSSTLASGKLLVGNGSNVATAVSMSGDATMDNAGAVTLATVPVSKGGTNVTSFTANKIVGTNGTGTALTSFSCPLNQVITFDVTGTAVCSSVSSLSTGYVNGGNSFGANATLGTNDNYALNFKTNNSTKMTLSAGGFLGIGTSTPGSPLDITLWNSSGSGDLLRLQNTSPGGFVAANFYDSSSSQVIALGYGNASASAYAGKVFFATGGKDLVFAKSIGGSDMVMSGSTGNVGIGTTSPSYPLHVAGSTIGLGSGIISLPATNRVNIGYSNTVGYNNSIGIGSSNSTGATDTSVAIGNGNTTTSDLAVAIGNYNTAPGNGVAIGLNINNTVGGSLQIGPSNTAKATILSNGNFGIGTTSPGAKLDVAGEVKFGNTSSTCNATNEGQQRYNSTSKNMEFCNGTAWTAYGAAGSSGRTSCPAGFTLIGTSGTAEAFCVSSVEETSNTWLAATTACYNKSPKARLCSASEWAMACVAGASGPNNMTGNWEWVADLYNNEGEVMGGSGCDSFGVTTVNFSYGSRCCFR